MHTRKQFTQRFAMVLVAVVSLLAVTVAAGPAAAAADPKPLPSAVANDPGAKVVVDKAAAAYECAAGAVCFYSGSNGTGWRLTYYGCGFLGLGNYPDINEKVNSAYNRSSYVASLYNWTGHGYELKGWLYAGGAGNFTNIGADVVHLFC